eukprot:1006072-Rhodomonas_salina.4
MHPALSLDLVLFAVQHVELLVKVHCADKNRYPGMVDLHSRLLSAAPALSGCRAWTRSNGGILTFKDRR